MYRCASHPSQAVVGICSACLRERLMKLAKANYEQRRSEIVYMPDPSSWGYLRFKRKNSDDVEGIRELDLNSSRITTSKSENYNSSDKKKAARNVRFSGFRSFLGFLRKRACRNNVCVRGRLEDGMQRHQDRSGDLQDSWIPSVTTKTQCPSSTRRSVSERRSTAMPYSHEDPALRRSTSDYLERETLGSHEEIEDTIKGLWNHSEKYLGKLMHSSVSRTNAGAEELNAEWGTWRSKGSKVDCRINDCLPNSSSWKLMNDVFGRPRERNPCGSWEFSQQSAKLYSNSWFF